MLDVLDLPWDRVGAMCGALVAMLTLLTMLGTRWGPFRRLIGRNIQEMLGVKAVNDSLSRYIDDRAAIDRTVENAVQTAIDTARSAFSAVQETQTTMRDIITAQTTTQSQLADLATMQKETQVQLQVHARNGTRHNPARRRSKHAEA